MMYIVPEHINKNKIFVVNRSELEGRIDPHQFHIERVTAISKIKLNNEIVKLKKAVKNVKSTTTKVENTDIYIGLENIESDTGKYTETNEKNSISSAGIFKKGNVLFPKLRPYLNKVHLADFDGICSTEFHIFEGTESFLNEFLVIYLRSNLIVNQTKHLMTGNTLPRLQTEDINNLPVPKISIEKQKDIIRIYNDKINLKQQKEAEAKALLDGIDSYLLDELGITLPEQNNALENRIFTTNFSEVTGGRIDPDYQRPFYKNIYQRVLESKYSIYNLKKLTEILQGGKTPASLDYSDEETDFPIIKVGSYSDDFIDLEKTGYCQKEQKLISKKGDIFILSAAHQSEYVGKHIKILNETPKRNTSYVGELICVRANNKIEPIYLFALLKTNIYKSIINREKTGQTSHIYGRDLKNIPIPLPDRTKQIEIANNIQDKFSKAILLKSEAKQILQEAQNQVEQMIIG